MDEQGESRADEQVFALRQVAKKTIDHEKARVTCTHFSVFYKAKCRGCYIIAEELLICSNTYCINNYG